MFYRILFKLWRMPVAKQSRMSSQITMPGKNDKSPKPLSIQTIVVSANKLKKSWVPGGMRDQKDIVLSSHQRCDCQVCRQQKSRLYSGMTYKL